MKAKDFGILPDHAKSCEEFNMASENSGKPVHKYAVCFVDDDPEEIRRFQDNLRDYFIIGAGTSISEALSNLKNNGRSKPDLFLLDMYFPEGPRNTETELHELSLAREKFLTAQSAFLSVLARLRQSPRGGFDLARGLSNYGRYRFAFFTRKGTLEDAVEAFRNRALAVLKKPDPNQEEKKGTLNEAYDVAFTSGASCIARDIQDIVRRSTWWARNKRAVIGFKSL